MGVNTRKDKHCLIPPVLTQFWEAWLLVLVLVTILALFGQTQPRPLLTQTDYNRSQFDPLQVQSEAPSEQGRPLESGF